MQAGFACRAIHGRGDQYHRADLHRDHSNREHNMRRAQDLDVEPVSVMPPVVEGRRGDHDEAAPRADESPERPSEA